MENLGARLKAALKTELEPVGVRFYKPDDDVKDDVRKLMAKQGVKSYCNAITLAARGTAFYAGVEKLGCKLGSSVLGLEDAPEPFLEANVKEKYNAGLYASEDASRVSIDGARKFNAGTYQSVLIGPLSELPDEPQVVILEVNPEEAMWLLYAANYKKGGIQALPQAGGVAGGCADVTVMPMEDGRVNMTFLGLGCRLKSSIPANRLLFGLPFSMLEDVVEHMERLANPIAKLAAAESFK